MVAHEATIVNNRGKNEQLFFFYKNYFSLVDVNVSNVYSANVRFKERQLFNRALEFAIKEKFINFRV